MTLEAIKQDILKRTIEEDQQAVAEQWANTFEFNDKADSACHIAKLTFACIAKGDFKVRTSLISKELINPSDVLTIADYLSHASRIIIDYEKLSEENKKILLAYFSSGKPRVATHAVKRNGQINELKGKIYGFQGGLQKYRGNSMDYGINIAMGGLGNKNFAGKTIAASGYSGHIYFHRNDQENLLMIGLEQCAPYGCYDEDEKCDEEEFQENTDQFGQHHSLLGHSDTYTAAGSLYFSNPIYQKKLLDEKHALPPDKYGGMLIALNNHNFTEILEFTDNIYTKELLLQKPDTAVQQVIGKDFDVNFEQIIELHDKIDLLKDAKINELEKLKDLLLDKNHIDNVKQQINKIESDNFLREQNDALNNQINKLQQMQKENATNYNFMLNIAISCAAVSGVAIVIAAYALAGLMPAVFMTAMVGGASFGFFKYCAPVEIEQHVEPVLLQR